MYFSFKNISIYSFFFLFAFFWVALKAGVWNPPPPRPPQIEISKYYSENWLRSNIYKLIPKFEFQTTYHLYVVFSRIQITMVNYGD
jgi:hypothetical protein